MIHYKICISVCSGGLLVVQCACILQSVFTDFLFDNDLTILSDIYI